MPKGIDQFEKFKAATLTSSTLGNVIADTDKPNVVKKEQNPAAASPVTNTQISAPGTKSKPAEEQVSFFIDRDLKKAVGLLKYELGVSLKDLYEEAVRDLLIKYHKI